MGEFRDCGTQTCEFGSSSSSSNSSPRVEIITSAPFTSVAEAVTRFGGHGFWIPPSSSSSLNPDDDDDDDIDGIKKLDHQQQQQVLKDLNLKHEKPLDIFMDELNLTKNLIHQLEIKLKLHKNNNNNNNDTTDDNSSSVSIAITTVPCSLENSSSLVTSNCSLESSPAAAGGEVELVEVISELEKAKLELSESTSELTTIRDTVESLIMKLEREDISLSSTSLESSSNLQKLVPSSSSSIEKKKKKNEMIIDNYNTPERSTNYPPAHSLTNCPDTTNVGSSSSSSIMSKHHVGISRELQELNHEADQFMRTAELAKGEVTKAMLDIERTKTGLKMIELRCIAAKKMEEAAHAAEQLALAEIQAMSMSSSSNEFTSVGHEQRKKKMTISLSLEEYNTLAEKAAASSAKGTQENYQQRFAPVMIADVDDQTLTMTRRGGRRGKETAVRKMALEQFMNRVEVADRRRLILRRKDNCLPRKPRECNDDASYDLINSSFLSRNLSLQGNGGGLNLLGDDTNYELHYGEEENSGGNIKGGLRTSIGDVLRRKKKKKVVWRDDLDLEREGEMENGRVSLNQMIRNQPTETSNLERKRVKSDGKYYYYLFWKKMKGLGTTSQDLNSRIIR